MDLFRGYVQGYCHEMGRILTAKEKELMVYAVWLMTMESGIHFLTDYLSGDRNMTNFPMNARTCTVRESVFSGAGY